MNEQATKSAEPKRCRHCGTGSTKSPWEHRLGCRLLCQEDREARRAAGAYVPGELTQRPPLDIAEAKLHEMLETAMTYGFVTGSVGSTVRDEDDNFTYEVSYTIKRKKR